MRRAWLAPSSGGHTRGTRGGHSRFTLSLLSAHLPVPPLPREALFFLSQPVARCPGMSAPPPEADGPPPGSVVQTHPHLAPSGGAAGSGLSRAPLPLGLREGSWGAPELPPTFRARWEMRRRTDRWKSNVSFAEEDNEAFDPSSRARCISCLLLAGLGHSRRSADPGAGRQSRARPPEGAEPTGHSAPRRAVREAGPRAERGRRGGEAPGTGGGSGPVRPTRSGAAPGARPEALLGRLLPRGRCVSPRIWAEALPSSPVVCPPRSRALPGDGQLAVPSRARQAERGGRGHVFPELGLRRPRVTSPAAWAWALGCPRPSEASAATCSRRGAGSEGSSGLRPGLCRAGPVRPGPWRLGQPAGRGLAAAGVAKDRSVLCLPSARAPSPPLPLHSHESEAPTRHFFLTGDASAPSLVVTDEAPRPLQACASPLGCDWDGQTRAKEKCLPSRHFPRPPAAPFIKASCPRRESPA